MWQSFLTAHIIRCSDHHNSKTLKRVAYNVRTGDNRGHAYINHNLVTMHVANLPKCKALPLGLEAKTQPLVLNWCRTWCGLWVAWIPSLQI